MSNYNVARETANLGLDRTAGGSVTSAVNFALMRIPKRAEQSDRLLAETFVNTGSLIDLLTGLDHQVVYGRRGTGKTHALKYLAQTVEQAGDVAIYVDLRTVGSNSSIYNDPDVGFVERGSRLLVDVLTHVHDALTTVVLRLDEGEGTDFTQAMRQLDQFASEITGVRIDGDISQKTSDTQKRSVEGSASLTASLSDRPALGVSMASTGEVGSERQVAVEVSGAPRVHLHFGAVQGTVTAVVAAIPAARLWILLDEWPAIPLDLQPLLADMLKRCLFPVSGVTVKIAAIERASRFRTQLRDGSFIGIELGSDASADLDLDQFMVFHNDSAVAKDFFGELFFRHVMSGLAAENRTDEAPQSREQLLATAFTQAGAFVELVKAAEGVPRDAINVAALAAQATPDAALSTRTVADAARRWYLQDKEASVAANERAKRLLDYIHDEVIGERRARAFLLQQSDAQDPLIADLYRERVLHVIKRGVATYVDSGVRYDIYQIDYGAYVHLRTTNRAVQGLFELDEEDGGGYANVPRDDYRSIRRAILRLDDFRAGRTKAKGRAVSLPRVREDSTPTLGLDLLSPSE